ncbi:MAG TPA: type II secretion system protein [Thermoanaerobaculia bacterium]|nr:type II secretion system protein [Thermoanaerobaculia bacterium]
MQRKRGFTLLEVLIVVGIVGILATIAIANYYNAIQRARQKRTMADVRSLALAWEARAIDVKTYNAAAIGFTMPGADLTYGEVSTLLSPTYMRNIPQFDGWNHPLDFATDLPIGGGPGAAYAIRSAGRDGAFLSGSYTPGPTTNFDCDIVFSSGAFVVWPEGTQQR